MRLLNICLHNVIPNDITISSPYELKVDQLRNLVNIAEAGKAKGMYDDFVLYFDDSYASFSNIVVKLDFLSHIPKTNIKVAVIVEKLGQPGFMTQDDVVLIHKAGYGVESHGYSHSALAVFENGLLQDTPMGGDYRSSPYGKGRPLSVEEIKYQLIESKKYLENLINSQIEEFILPYGLYNQTVIEIIQTSDIYKKALTCHTAIDSGSFLAPRHLVTQDNLDTLEATIFNMPATFKLLGSID